MFLSRHHSCKSTPHCAEQKKSTLCLTTGTRAWVFTNQARCACASTGRQHEHRPRWHEAAQLYLVLCWSATSSAGDLSLAKYSACWVLVLLSLSSVEPFDFGHPWKNSLVSFLLLIYHPVNCPGPCGLQRRRFSFSPAPRLIRNK